MNEIHLSVPFARKLEKDTRKYNLEAMVLIKTINHLMPSSSALIAMSI
jgi:hypothetical protein